MLSTMNGWSQVSSSVRSLLSNQNLKKFVPEPRSRIASTFKTIAQAATAVARNDTVHHIAPEYEELLQTQMEFQKQMQLVSLTSNVEKSKHESRMAAIRNVRTS